MPIDNLKAFEQYVRNVVQGKRDSAGFSGSWDDGGASKLEDTIDAYMAGVNGTIPKSLKELHIEFLKSQDPDVQAYLELQKKLEGKYGKA